MLPALKFVQSTRKIKRLANFVFLGLIVSMLAILFLPWQQTSRGTGRVTAFIPQERQQTVSSPIKGIVLKVAAGLREGDAVKRDQVILELQPAAASMVGQMESQAKDLKTKQESIKTKMEVYRQNVKDFSEAKEFAVNAAQEMVDSAKAKLDSKKRMLPGYEAKELQARLNLDRQSQLYEKGATSEKDVEKLRRDFEIAKSELEATRLEVTAAEFEVSAKKLELEQKRSEMQTRVDGSRAFEQGAIGEFATIQKEIRELEIKRDELQQLVIRSPRDGTIFRLPVFERGQTVKEGDPLFTIVPDTQELAVEVWISGLDIPLVLIGDHVRLQFEGWPAVQFAGWPSVAVGTFGGEVVAIDNSDDGLGRFRIQIRPIANEPWPSVNELRQGVRANGWVILRKVSLGYEIWRQLNGFPPIRSDNSPSMQKPETPEIKI